MIGSATQGTPGPVGVGRLRRVFDAAVNGLLLVAVAAASVAVFLQVVFRYVFNSPISWIEEFAVFMFAWIIFLGTAYVHRTDSHISIDLIRRGAPGPFARFLDRLRLLVQIGVGGVLIWQGTLLTQRILPVEFPGMEISRAFLYGGVPVCFTIGLIYLIIRLVRGDPSSVPDGQKGTGAG